MTNFAAQDVRMVLTLLAGAAARSLALATVAAVFLALFRVSSVRVKLFVWKGVLAGALAMPALMLLAPAVEVAVPVPSFPHRTAAEVEATAPAPIDSNTLSFTQSTSDDVRVGNTQQVLSPAQPIAAPNPNETSLPRESSSEPAYHPIRRPISWMLLLAAVYATIAIALLLRVLIGLYFSARLTRAALAVDEPWAHRAVEQAARAAGLRKAPRLLESETLSVPVMVGVFRPTILLTPGWQEWAPDEFAAVLAHEVSHVARRDALAQRLALVHRALFWFSPLSWWLERRLADLAEQASDEAALSGGMDRTRYAEALLGFFAELEASSERVWWQGVSMAKAGQAEKRVDRILAWRGAMSNRWTRSLVMGLLVLGVPLIVLTSAVRLSAYDIQTPPVPPAPPAPVAAPATASLPAPPAVPAPAAAPAQDAQDPQEASPDTKVAPQPEDDAGDVNVRVKALAPLPQIRVFVPPVNVDVPAVHVELPDLHVEVPPVHVAMPQIHIETHLLSPQDLEMVNQDGPVVFSSNGDWNFGGWGGYYVGRYDDWHPRFAIVSKDSDALTMSGDRDDAEHARALKQKYSGDFIWFKREDKSYVISDSATVSRAKQLWQPTEDLSKQQKDLSKQMQDLQKQMEDSRQKFEDAKIKLPDMTAEMQKLEQTMKQLSANGGTMNDISELQRQMGELQREIGQAESSAGRESGAWGHEQSDIGRKMGEVGRQMGDLGHKQAQASRDAAHQMQQLLDDAVSKGLAKPE